MAENDEIETVAWATTNRVVLTPSDHLTLLAVKRHEALGERLGQATFNVMAERWPLIAERVRGRELDPFYAQVGSDRYRAAMATIRVMVDE